MYFKRIFLLFVMVCCVSTQSITIEEEVKNSTTFTLDWYRESFDGNKNTIISPISFRILLSLIYQSTVGYSEQELMNYVYFSNKDDTSRSQQLSLDKLMASPNLKVVNRVYVKKGFTLNKAFLAKATEYKSGVEEKDFANSKQTADEINQYVEEQTNGLIKDLVSEQIFNEDTALLLLNTLYFKANWLTQFDNEKVKKSVFYTYDGLVRYNNAMRATASFKTCKFPRINASILELPYAAKSNTKFWIIKPNANTNIFNLKNLLTYDVLTKISKNLKHKPIHVEIPMFSIENEVPGIAILRKLGLQSIFDKFEIVALEDESNKLRVTDARQKTKIIVNTAGTEAAAASSVAIGTRGTVDPMDSFIVNRPFIYMILMADTNEPIFIGHYSKPN